MTTAMKPVDPYHAEYDGFYTMKFHDAETNALKRWFENFKVDRMAYFANDFEWLVVHEKPSTSKSRTRFRKYVCEIGRDDMPNNHRFVAMDHTAPKPPNVFMAAKRKYEPPPPKTPSELKREAEWDYMMRRGYEPVRYPIYPEMMPRFLDYDEPPKPIRLEVDYGIQWVKKPTPIYAFVDSPSDYKPPTPPAPKHRRNV